MRTALVSDHLGPNIVRSAANIDPVYGSSQMSTQLAIDLIAWRRITRCKLNQADHTDHQ